MNNDIKNKQIAPHLENELENLLKLWFNTIDLDKPKVFVRNKIAKLIKTELKKRKHWKCAPRAKHIEVKICECGGELFEVKGKIYCSDLFCKIIQ